MWALSFVYLKQKLMKPPEARAHER
jgi:hypothetical protein